MCVCACVCLSVVQLQDEWVVCRIFQKSAGGKKLSSFLYADSRFLQDAFLYQQLDDLTTGSATALLPAAALGSLQAQSPNPTVTDDDDGNFADCETCGGGGGATNNYNESTGAGCISCATYPNCHDSQLLQSSPNFFNHKENTAPLPASGAAGMWITAKSRSGVGAGMILQPQQAGSIIGMSGMDQVIHQAAAGSGTLMSSMAKLCPNYELGFDPSSGKNMSIMPRMDFASQAYAAQCTSNLISLKALERASLRAKLEPYCYNGDDDDDDDDDDDEAQSSQRVTLGSYHGWGNMEHHQHHHHPIFSEPLQRNLIGADVPCITQTLCGAPPADQLPPGLFRYNNNKFGLPEATVDSLERMFA